MSGEDESTIERGMKRKPDEVNEDANDNSSQPITNLERYLCAFCPVRDLNQLVSYCRQCKLVICAKCTEAHIDKKLVGHKVEKYRSHLVDPNEDTWYPVERIVGKKMRAGKVVYKVKWENWPPSANSWEPAENISQDIIEAYEIMAQADKLAKRAKIENEKCC